MKKRFVFVLVLVLLAASCLVAIQPINAAKTIAVPDDYPTITAALVNAEDGDTIFVKKGTYEGPINQTLMINKTLSLVGEDASNTRINLHPSQYTTTMFTQTWSSYHNSIQIDAKDVRLSGFTIASDGGYITAMGNGTVIVRNIIKTALYAGGYNQTVTDNTLTADIYCGGTYCTVASNNAVKSLISCSGSYNIISSNNVSEAPNAGIAIGGSGNLIYSNIIKDGGGVYANGVGNIVANNTIINCSWGIGIYHGFNNTVCTNTITNNRGAGLIKTEGYNNNFFANYVANNAIGTIIGSKPQLNGNTTLYHNNFVNNTQQAQYIWSIIEFDYIDYFDNGREGNYWSDYTGRDDNGDGIGDTPYVIDANRSDRYPLMAPFDIEKNTVVLPPPEPFPTATVATAAGASVAVIGVGLLVYFKKRKH